MRIERIELKGIGPFDDAVFEIPEPKGPGELVLFEGPNGCGKTTVAQVLAGLAEDIFSFLNRGIPENFSLSRLLGRRLRGRDHHLLIRLDEDGIEPRTEQTWRTVEALRLARLGPSYKRSVQVSLSDAERSVTWAAFAYGANHPTAVIETSGPRDIGDSPSDDALSLEHKRPASNLLGQLLTNMEFERVRKSAYAAERREDPEESGILAAEANARKASILRFAEAVSLVLGRRVEIEFPLGQMAPRIRFDVGVVPLDLLGEGIRNTFSWLTDLLVRLERTPWKDTTRSPFEQEFWLILDEVDEGLHPKAQRLVLPALRKLFPNARIYATTHSPFVVASAGEGTVFAIRPDRATHRVRGAVEPRPLEHGQSLAWVVDEIFDAPSGFVDEETREALRAHREAVDALRRGEVVDWDTFFQRRDFLLGLNEEVRAVVAMREVPVRKQISDALTSRTATNP